MAARRWDANILEFALTSAKNGDSAGAISAQIWAKFKVHKSRNAVIGIVHRAGRTLGRNGRATLVANGRKSGRVAAALARSRKNPQAKLKLSSWLAPEPLPPAQETDVARVSFLDLDEKPIAIELHNGAIRIARNHCKFVCLPEPAAPHVPQFCGDERVEGLAYCAHHAKRCTQAPVPRSYLPPARHSAGMGTGKLDALKEFEGSH